MQPNAGPKSGFNADGRTRKNMNKAKSKAKPGRPLEGEPSKPYSTNLPIRLLALLKATGNQRQTIIKALTDYFERNPS